MKIKHKKKKIDILIQQNEKHKHTQNDEPSTSNHQNDLQYVINVERPRQIFNTLNEDKLLKFNTFDEHKNLEYVISWIRTFNTFYEDKNIEDKKKIRFMVLHF